MGRDPQTKEATCYAVKTALRKQKLQNQKLNQKQNQK